MEILGYGEDALTYWCLSKRLQAVLAPFHDDVSQTLAVFYRPSFGRRSKGAAATPAIRGPQFGEFDGIVTTRRGVYLIEAKWTNSSEIDDSMIVLRREQLRRHQVFRRYLEAWRKHPSAEWASFVAQQPTIELGPSSGPSELFRTAPEGSLLASNLATVLKHCVAAGAEVEDVLLVVHPQAQSVSKTRRSPNGFTVVELQCPDMKDGYVVLGAA